MVEGVLGFVLEKGHSAVDWSTRPLPEPWLRYAALDVELLVDLRDALEKELDRQGKLEWARQEFDAIASAPPAEPRKDPWRRTSGMHKVRRRRQLARRAGAVGGAGPDRPAAGRVAGQGAVRRGDRRGRALPAGQRAGAGRAERVRAPDGAAAAGAVAGRRGPGQGAAGVAAAAARAAGDRAPPAAGLGRQGSGGGRPAVRRAGRGVRAGRAAEHASGEPDHPGHGAAGLLGAAEVRGRGIRECGAGGVRGAGLAGGAGDAGAGGGAVRGGQGRARSEGLRRLPYPAVTSSLPS